MLYIFICEDEEVQLNYIRNMLTEYIKYKGMDAKIAAAEKDPKDILSKLKDEYQPAVFFIDVQLDGADIDGFGLAQRLKELRCGYDIVFLTSNTHMAYKAFEYRLEVLDYIVKKPEYFWQETISESLMKRLDVIFEKAGGLCDKRNKETIALACGRNVTEVVVIEDIILIQSVAGKHLTDVCLHDRMITARQPLKSLYEQLGESGSGKSSLVRAIIGVNNQYSGEILFDGIERRRYHDKSVLKLFAYISQNIYLFTDTIRFNLTLGEKYSDEELYETLEKVNLSEFISESAKGLDRMISNQQNNISGGQRQRIGIARALLQGKKIYVIDEGTSALDYKNATLIEDFFLSNQEYTILFITHHLNLSEKKFDKIYTI